MTEFQDSLLAAIHGGAHCEGCPAFVSRTDRFCHFCGRENPDFDTAQFLREMRKPFAEAAAIRCSDGHEVVREEMARNLVFRQVVREAPFCEYCGARLAEEEAL